MNTFLNLSTGKQQLWSHYIGKSKRKTHKEFARSINTLLYKRVNSMRQTHEVNKYTTESFQKQSISSVDFGRTSSSIVCFIIT